jgi:hypothetical protein
VFPEVDWSSRDGCQARRWCLIAFDEANLVNDEWRAEASLDGGLHGNRVRGRAAGHQTRSCVTGNTVVLVLV